MIMWIMDDYGNFITFLPHPLCFMVKISWSSMVSSSIIRGGSSTRSACAGATQRLGPGKLGNLQRSQCGLRGSHPKGGTGGARRAQRSSGIRGAQQG